MGIQQGCRQSPHPRTHVTTKMARATGGQIRKKKGEAGAAKNYITRTQAIKKLQCSMADFRRLCILKGIFPRQPKSTKKANKGSTAPASFYYIKDIQYLLHEPVLQKLRQYKTFSKKLSKAVGRGEWTTAKSLEENQKPKYRLDHIIKERYPSFPDALRDLDDALSLIVLFAHLPASEKVPASIIANCSRLAAEWQLYVMKTRSLSKVFLSIKGIYFQAIVKGETVTWLVPYMFTQNVPTDVDFRIMMTFLELYQTLLGFTFYKLYSDINLVYPPKFDTTKDDEGAGIGALLLEETSRTLTIEGKKETEEDIDKVNAGKKVTAKDVNKQIRSITHHGAASTADQAMVEDDSMAVEPSSASLKDDLADVPQSTEQGGQDVQEHDIDISDLFSNYYFYLSREVTRPTLEFVIRSFGGQVGWDDVLGAGSPYSVNDPRITHHIVDRPVPRSSEPMWKRSEMKWKAKKRAMRRRKRRRRNLPALETILKQSRPKSWMLTPAISPVQRCWQLPPTPTTRPCPTLLSSRQRARACLTVNFKPSSPPSQRRPRRPQQLPTKRAQQRRRQMHCRHPPPRSRIQHPSCYPTSSASCTIR